MKTRISFFNVLFNLIVAVFIALVTAPLSGALAPLVALAIFALGCVPGKRERFSFMMAVQREIWLADLQETLFPEGSFYERATDHTSMVVNGKTVHIAESGTKPGVSINRTALPATVTKRTDSDKTYDLDEYTTDPILVQDTEEVEVSYAKRASVLSQHVGTLNENFMTTILNKWAVANGTNIIRTTGNGEVTALSGATGNRRKVLVEDFKNAARLLDNMKVPASGRVAVMPVSMFYQLFSISELVTAFSMGTTTLPNGVIKRLMGFDIYIVPDSNALVFDNAGTPALKSVGAAGAAADNQATLFYHPNFVAMAKGEITIFESANRPEYYGDIISALVRFGGRKLRNNEVGVVALVQAAVA